MPKIHSGYTGCLVIDSPCSDTINYAPLDFTIDGMYLTQSTQTYTNTIPMVKDRDGVLRISVRANRDTRAEPVVRVRWYSSGALVRTDLVNGPNTGYPVPQTILEQEDHWLLPVPGSLIQPNLSVLADIDPGNVAGEGDRTNNSFPVSGTPAPLDVRTASLFHVTIVPVMSAADGLTGSYSTSGLLSLVQRMHPIPGYVATNHAIYITAEAVPLIADDGNGEWFSILNQLSALRVAEGVSDSEYFYGVVHPLYNAGVAGLGWIGGTAAVGWDKDISDKIAAHEIGHNWGRQHSPCGGPAGVDPNWPADPKHAGALIGAYGYDVAAGSLLSPYVYYDIMSYCQVNQWTSDYTYMGIMDYRAAVPSIVAAASSAPEPSLLVWGRMRGGRLVLEPAFELVTRPRVPNGRGGNYLLEGLDARGSRLFSYGFDGEEVADLPHGGRGFAFAIPLSLFSVSELASLRLSGTARPPNSGRPDRGGEPRRIAGRHRRARGVRAARPRPRDVGRRELPDGDDPRCVDGSGAVLRARRERGHCRTRRHARRHRVGRRAERRGAGAAEVAAAEQAGVDVNRLSCSIPGMREGCWPRVPYRHRHDGGPAPRHSHPATTITQHSRGRRTHCKQS